MSRGKSRPRPLPKTSHPPTQTRQLSPSISRHTLSRVQAPPYAPNVLYKFQKVPRANLYLVIAFLKLLGMERNPTVKDSPKNAQTARAFLYPRIHKSALIYAFLKPGRKPNCQREATSEIVHTPNQLHGFASLLSNTRRPLILIAIVRVLLSHVNTHNEPISKSPQSEFRTRGADLRHGSHRSRLQYRRHRGVLPRGSSKSRFSLSTRYLLCCRSQCESRYNGHEFAVFKHYLSITDHSC
jgi:hypothetical protein